MTSRNFHKRWKYAVGGALVCAVSMCYTHADESDTGGNGDMLRLEKYTETDEERFAQVVFNEPAMRMNLGRVLTEEEAKAFFQMALTCNADDPVLGFYQVFREENGERESMGMGALKWNDDHHAVEIEYMLLPSYWHQGYGTELVGLLLRKADEARRGADVAAITDPGNTYSKRILQRARFQFVRQYVNGDGELAELYLKKAGTDA